MNSLRLQPAERRVLSVEEAAALLGVSKYLAYREIKRTGTLSGIPPLRVGKRVLIPRLAFERAVDNGPEPDPLPWDDGAR